MSRERQRPHPVAERRRSRGRAAARSAADRHPADLAQQIPVTLWTTNTHLRLTFAAGPGLAAIGLSRRPGGPGGPGEALVAIAHRRALAGASTSWEHEHAGRVFAVRVDPLGRPRRATVCGVIGVAIEVTERRRIEDELARLVSLVEFSSDAIVATTLDETIASWNAGATRLYGWTAAEAVGQPLAMLVPPDRQEELAEIRLRLARGERVEHFETVRLRKDGSRVDISITISPLRDRAGHVVGASSIGRDITGRKHAEATEREAEVLRSVTRLAGAAAHEFNNPLTVVLGNLQLLARDVADPLARQRIELAIAAGERIHDIVRRMNRITRLELAERLADVPDMLDLTKSALRPDEPPVS